MIILWFWTTALLTVTPCALLRIPSSMEDSFLSRFEDPVQAMLEFCPFTQSCRKDNVTKEPEIGNKCCLPCDCSDRCYATGTCCTEMTNGSRHQQHPDASFSLTEESCVSTFISSSDNKIHNSSYMLFVNCSDNRDYKLQNKCMHPDVMQIDEIIPVFSQKTNRHYRNIFCAKCNNDARYLVHWRTRLICNSSVIMTSGFPKISDTFSVSEIISTNPGCSLLWDPPPESRVDHCFDEQNLISDCNNPFLDSLCKQYYAPVNDNGIFYRNIFCMECAISTEIEGQCNPFHFIFPVISFTSILSLNVEENTVSNTNTSETIACPFPKVYSNKLVSSSLKLLCLFVCLFI